MTHAFFQPEALIRVYTFSVGAPFTPDLLKDSKQLDNYFKTASHRFQQLALLPHGATFYTSLNAIREKNTLIHDIGPQTTMTRAFGKETLTHKAPVPANQACILECLIPRQELSVMQLKQAFGPAHDIKLAPKESKHLMLYSAKGITVLTDQVTRIFPIVSLASYDEKDRELVKAAITAGIKRIANEVDNFVFDPELFTIKSNRSFTQ